MDRAGEPRTAAATAWARQSHSRERAPNSSVAPFPQGTVHSPFGGVVTHLLRQERLCIEQPAIDLYDLSKKIQYHVTRKEFDIANDLLKDLPSDRSQEMKKMFDL